MKKGCKMENEIKKENPINFHSITTDNAVEEKLMKPFSLGWKREVVKRVVAVHNYCDIYYLNPEGKRLRSMNEIKPHLADGLTLDCFTFKKTPLNVTSEIVRTAVVRDKCNKKLTDHKPVNRAGIAGRLKRKKNKKMAEKMENPKSETQRQRMMKKKERLTHILDINKSKKKNAMPTKKEMKKTDEKGTKTISRRVRKAGNISKTEFKKKANRLVTPNGVNKSLEDNVLPGIETDNVGTGRKKEFGDIKSIVQRNIGKYREIRKNQLLGQKDGLQRNSRNIKSCNIIRKRRRYEPISMNLDTYMKPFESGWRRELVHRVNGQSSAGLSDVYYFHPSGKKLRSSREIADNLTQGLTLECFTFRKEAIGCGEPYEVVRNARLYSSMRNNKKIT